ncbi:hypothetical protein DPMN_003199 [Dreissena polymorpha]|uniref:Uncharacterized protein n=1 Tax=Dreissena polymorpha TaxID=45954 RepID=A0A9D4MQ63_DREPO|nr:hypothetical protein DPMN_003199 [Dreissena polymorpha]
MLPASWMHKAYTHSEKENELRDSNQELRIQCDELQRKLRELGTVEKPGASLWGFQTRQ